MKCPKCPGIELTPGTPGEYADPTYSCPQCSGIWSDLNDLAASPGRAKGQTSLPQYAHKRDNVVCPKCELSLFEYCYPGTEILVEGCQQCHGVWLDKMEMTAIRASLAVKKQLACPRCQMMQDSATVCTNCGVIFEKYHQQQNAMKDDALALAQRIDLIFSGAASYGITKNVEWLEVFSPFEVRNRYDVVIRGQKGYLGSVEERSRSIFNVIGRFLLGSLRPAELQFDDEEGNPLLTMHKRFRLYFHQLDLADANHNDLGSVRRRFHLLRANYDVRDKHGKTVLEIRGPLFFLPFVDNVFRVTKNGKEVGGVMKRWSGILKELFTDADAFQMNIDRSLSVTEKVLFFGAVFLIDFGQFENNEQQTY